MIYRDYLRSPHWKALKAKKQMRTAKRCAICGAAGQIDCHHIFYRNLSDVAVGDLRWLCRRCHDVAHDLLRVNKIKPQRKKRGNAQTWFLITKNLVFRELGANRHNED